MIITFGSIKGGPGKTTAALNSAVALAKQGRDVICIDADKQMSLTKWFSYREGGINIHSAGQLGDIARTLTNFQSRYQDVVVDVAGADTEELVTALQVSDFLICPVEPSQLDLDTIPDFLKVISYAKRYNKSLQVRFFLNRCAPLHTMDNTLEVAEVLSEMDGITLLKTKLYINKQFVSAFPFGKSILEIDTATKAAINFNELFIELEQELFHAQTD